MTMTIMIIISIISLMMLLIIMIIMSTSGRHLNPLPHATAPCRSSPPS